MLQKEGKNMTRAHYEEYLDRAEDIGQQLLDLVAEMRADPPVFRAGIALFETKIVLKGGDVRRENRD